MRPIRLTGAVLLLLAIYSPAWAGALEDGIAAYNGGHPEAAYKLLRPLADQGNADAQVDIGVLYANGEGVRQDYTEALAWYRKAADQGDVFALNNIGLMYMRGQGVKPDDAEAVNRYRQAAQKNFAPAQFNLASMYAQGRGVTTDKAEAFKWLTLAIVNYSPDDEDQRDDAEIMLDRLSGGMTADEIAEGHRRADEIKPKPKSK